MLGFKKVYLCCFMEVMHMCGFMKLISCIILTSDRKEENLGLRRIDLYSIKQIILLNKL